MSKRILDEELSGIRPALPLTGQLVTFPVSLLSFTRSQPCCGCGTVRYDSIWSNGLYFTPDSQRWVMGASRGPDTFLVVDSIDDKPIGSFVAGSVPVFDGNDRFHIITRRGSNYYRLDVRIIEKLPGLNSDHLPSG